MAQTVLYKNLRINDISNQPSAKNKAGGSQVPLAYSGMRNFMIQTPILSAPFGISEYTPDNTPTKYSLEFSFKNYENDPKIKCFMDKITELDNYLIDMAVTNSQEWFGKQMSKVVVEELYRPLLKPSKQPDKYAPTLKLKIRTQRADESKLSVLAFKNKENFDMEEFVPGTTAKAIVEVSPLWFVNKQFGTTLTLMALEIEELPTNKLNVNSFQDEDENEVDSDQDM